MLWNNRVDIEALFASFGQILDRVYADDALNEAMGYALFLENYEQRIRSMGKYSLEDILYERYYWFTKFLVRYEALYGKDAGMEQQQFQIIEAMEYADVVDSARLAKIEQDCGYHEA